MGSKPALAKRRTLLSVALGVIALCLVMCLCSLLRIGSSNGVMPTRTPRHNLTPTPTIKTTPTIFRTSTPTTPTNTPMPTRTLSPMDEMEKAIEDKLGFGVSGFRLDSESGLLTVEFNGRDNLTDGLIRSGIQQDVTDVLKAVYYRSGLVPYKSVMVVVWFKLTDSFGNTENSVIVRATYSLDTLKKVNWSKFKYSNVYTIADDIYLHPAAIP